MSYLNTNPPNGELRHTAEHGWVWSTECRKCGTRQQIRIGQVSLTLARQAVSQINHTPRECPGGFHVELSGWSLLWSLDLMLDRYEAALNAQTQNHNTTPHIALFNPTHQIP